MQSRGPSRSSGPFERRRRRSFAHLCAPVRRRGRASLRQRRRSGRDLRPHIQSDHVRARRHSRHGGRQHGSAATTPTRRSPPQQVTLSETVTQMTLASSSLTSSFLIVARVGRPESRIGRAPRRRRPASRDDRRFSRCRAFSRLHTTICGRFRAFPPAPSSPRMRQAASTVAWTSGPNGVAIGVGALAVERVAVRSAPGTTFVADVAPLAPGTTTAILVEIYDVPMALSLTNLSAGFSFTPDATASSGWAMTMQAAVARIEGLLRVDDTGWKPPLLDAMQAGIATSGAQAQFDLKRQQGGWDTLAATWLSTRGATISARADTWLTAATTDGIGPLGATGRVTGRPTAPLRIGRVRIAHLGKRLASRSRLPSSGHRRERCGPCRADRPDIDARRP